jgi:hypothetical protein
MYGLAASGRQAAYPSLMDALAQNSRQERADANLPNWVGQGSSLCHDTRHLAVDCSLGVCRPLRFSESIHLYP